MSSGIRAFLLLSLACLLFAGCKEDTRPNIVLIMADDVSPDLFSCFDELTPHHGEYSGKTPNIDEFVKNGVVFKTAYAAAMCLPSRVCLMTGKYGSTTGVIWNDTYLEGGRRKVLEKHLSIGRILRDAGYATAIAGKWNCTYTQPFSKEGGFQEYCIWDTAAQVERITGKALAPDTIAWETPGEITSRYWNPCLISNGRLVSTKPNDFGPDICAEFIRNFIVKQAGKKKPFFAYWPTVAPHSCSGGVRYPTNPDRGGTGDLGSEDDPDTTERFASLVEHLDGQIGTIRKTLQDLGIADNTLLIFCSDNGTWPTGKTRGVERGCHVVFMAEGAGTKARGMTDELMDFTDIAPTLAEYAETEPRQAVPFDGVSLRSFFTGASDETKPVIQGFIMCTQTLRSKTHMLEAVDSVLGVPEGRFYDTGESRFWTGYERLDSHSTQPESWKKFQDFLVKYPPITEDHPYWKTQRGERELKAYRNPRKAREHLTNPDGYRFYDQSLPEVLP